MRIYFYFILIVFFNSINKLSYAQGYNSVFIHAEYQAIKYNYLQFGIGYHKNLSTTGMLGSIDGSTKHTFIGPTLNFSKKLNSTDWGTSIQYAAYTGKLTIFPIGLGMEVNLKNVNQVNHIGVKPIFGLAYPFLSIMYGYNIDIRKLKKERISQHELILGLRFRAIKWR